MGINIRREDSIAAITEEYQSAWQAFCEEEMRTKQNGEDVINQAEARGEARERARRQQELQELETERAGRQDECRERDAYKARYGPLQQPEMGG